MVDYPSDLFGPIPELETIQDSSASTNTNEVFLKICLIR